MANFPASGHVTMDFFIGLDVKHMGHILYMHAKLAFKGALGINFAMPMSGTHKTCK